MGGWKEKAMTEFKAVVGIFLEIFWMVMAVLAVVSLRRIAFELGRKR